MMMFYFTSLPYILDRILFHYVLYVNVFLRFFSCFSICLHCAFMYVCDYVMLPNGVLNEL